MHPLVTLANGDFKYECTGSECSGRDTCSAPCCTYPRPPLLPEDIVVIERALGECLPLMRKECAIEVETRGYLSAFRKFGRPTLRQLGGGQCIFLNGGCVLHKLSLMQGGDGFDYKPTRCVLFPLHKREDGSWAMNEELFKDRDKPLEEQGPNAYFWPDNSCMVKNNSELPISISMMKEREFITKLESGEVPRFNGRIPDMRIINGVLDFS